MDLGGRLLVLLTIGKGLTFYTSMLVVWALPVQGNQVRTLVDLMVVVVVV